MTLSCKTSMWKATAAGHPATCMVNCPHSMRMARIQPFSAPRSVPRVHQQPWGHQQAATRWSSPAQQSSCSNLPADTASWQSRSDSPEGLQQAQARFCKDSTSQVSTLSAPSVLSRSWWYAAGVLGCAVCLVALQCRNNNRNSITARMPSAAAVAIVARTRQQSCSHDSTLELVLQELPQQQQRQQPLHLSQQHASRSISYSLGSNTAAFGIKHHTPSSNAWFTRCRQQHQLPLAVISSSQPSEAPFAFVTAFTEWVQGK